MHYFANLYSLSTAMDVCNSLWAAAVPGYADRRSAKENEPNAGAFHQSVILDEYNHFTKCDFR